MSFLAKLFIDNQVRNILNVNQVYSKLADINGRPVSRTMGHKLEFAIESTSDDTFFYESMFSATSKCQGEIVFYKRDGISTMFKMEFANAQILDLQESFNASNNLPLHMNIAIGWGIMKMRGVIHQEPWNPNNPFVEIEPTTRQEEEKEVTRYFVTDVEGNELDEYKTGEKIILNIETKNRIGDSITISLNDKSHDFKYGGQILENDKLSNYVINNDLEQIELDVINIQ
ncbi:type VI secretion system tube protein TssD [Olleya sp. ITB9]|uniref:type VI secretion system tube protein TssD n=1 Tax=Olleya sp. ITB9 TaxID=1715648 RepID=UPI0006D0127D|nr:type VI secretion system tube protein TssD [Olleya sp. ITB9]